MHVFKSPIRCQIRVGCWAYHGSLLIRDETMKRTRVSGNTGEVCWGGSMGDAYTKES